MCKKMQVFHILCVVLCMLLCVAGCGSKGTESKETESFADEESDSADAAAVSEDAGERDTPETETVVSGHKESLVPEKESHSAPIVAADLKPSEGFEFESNGDGTCTITGIGTCTDEDIVIPLESPAGETVTLIEKYAMYSLENVNSITLVNYTYEIDDNAFQYGEFTAVNIIGGSPVINKSAFSSCEDLTSISFRDCNFQASEYAFYSCGKDAEVTFSDCTGVIEKMLFNTAIFQP